MQRSMMFLGVMAALGFSGISTEARAAQWELDAAHSSVEFSVRHMTVSKVRGVFPGVTGTFDFDPKQVAKGKVDVTIDVASVDTRNEKRDEHLKSADFFDVAKHPTMRFVSKRITGKKGKFKILGDLTMRGVTKEVTLTVVTTGPVKSPWGQTVVGAEATAKINRKDFGVNWDKAMDKGGLVVGNEVQIFINLELIQKA